MRRFLLQTVLTLSLMGCSAGKNNSALIPQKVDDESEVYAAIVTERYRDITTPAGKEAKLLLILEATKADIERFQEYRKDMQSVSPDTLDHFLANNKQSYELRKSLNVKIKYSFITELEFKRLVITKDGIPDWSLFYDRYPEAAGILFFSKVGFNHEFTQALVEVTRGCERGCGEGAFYLLKKVNGVWTIDGIYGGWMS